MKMQRFTDGGFVCHKIDHITKSGHVSAWYGKMGELIDCELIRRDGVVVPIPERWVDVRRALAAIGGAYSI